MTQKDPEKFLASIITEAGVRAWTEGDVRWHENEWKEFIKNIRRQTIEECIEVMTVPYGKSIESGGTYENETFANGYNRALIHGRAALQQKLTSNE